MLVTGRPFEHARPAGWGWLFEGDRIDLQVTEAVGDVAVDLVDYHRARHDEVAAAEVIETLAKIDPTCARELTTSAAS